MSNQSKPEGYSSVSPYVIAEDTQRIIDFLIAVFDATELRRYEGPDGSILHAEVKIDDTVVMLGEGSDDFPAFPSVVHVYVPDVDVTYKEAMEAGGISVEEPIQREGDPDRRGSVKDPAGNTWAIATQAD